MPLLDLGKINNKYFVGVASIGFDAMAAHTVSYKLKKKIGAAAYACSGINTLFTHKKHLSKLEISTDQFSTTGYSIIISNIPKYAGFKLFPGALPNDGKMEAVILGKTGVFNTLRNAALIGAGGYKSVGKLKNNNAFEFDSFNVKCDGNIFMQLDGETYLVENKNKPLKLTMEVFKHEIDIWGVDK